MMGLNVCPGAYRDRELQEAPVHPTPELELPDWQIAGLPDALDCELHSERIVTAAARLFFGQARNARHNRCTLHRCDCGRWNVNSTFYHANSAGILPESWKRYRYRLPVSSPVYWCRYCESVNVCTPDGNNVCQVLKSADHSRLFVCWNC